MIAKKRILAVLVLVLGAGLVVSPAIAKNPCPKNCKPAFKNCKSDCKSLKGKAKKSCIIACKATFKQRRTDCKNGLPVCTPAGAFVNLSSDAL